MTIATVVAGDGAEIAVARWGDGVPLVVLLHATGFCKEVWSPVADELFAAGFGGSLVAMDQRTHGESGPFSGTADWWQLARDVVAVVAAMDRGPALGVGHSSGGAAMTMADLVSPGVFPRLLLIEPIIFPPGYGDAADLAGAARRRRPGFASRQQALEHFGDKPVFARWDRRALAAYVSGCLHDEGGQWVLDCTPDAEAAAYEAAARHGAWDRLTGVSVPVRIMVGARSLTHQREFAEAQAARYPEAHLEVVPDAGHFVPMEQPELIAARIMEWAG